MKIEPLNLTSLRWNPTTEDFDQEGQALSSEQLLQWMELPYYDPMGPAALQESMPWEERLAVGRYCEAASDDHRTLWARLRLRYAGYMFESARWPIPFLNLAHSQWVDSYAIRRFLVTDQDQRLFETQDQRFVTSSEFLFIFGETPLDSLKNHADVVAQHMKLVSAQMLSPLIDREVQIARGDGLIETLTIKTLEASSHENWSLPAGAKVLAHSPQSPTVPAEKDPQ